MVAFPNHVMALAYWIMVSSTSSKAPCYCCSNISQHRSIGLSVLRYGGNLQTAEQREKCVKGCIAASTRSLKNNTTIAVLIEQLNVLQTQPILSGEEGVGSLLRLAS